MAMDSRRICRRVQTPNQFFQERIAIPLGLDFYIGYPPAPEGVSPPESPSIEVARGRRYRLWLLSSRSTYAVPHHAEAQQAGPCAQTGAYSSVYEHDCRGQ